MRKKQTPVFFYPDPWNPQHKIPVNRAAKRQAFKEGKRRYRDSLKAGLRQAERLIAAGKANAAVHTAVENYRKKLRELRGGCKLYRRVHKVVA